MKKHKVGIPLRVLIIEDSQDDCALLLHELRRGGYEPSYRRVDTAKALETALAEQEWDIVFGDYTMPRFSGTQALSIIRSRGLDTPFIFLSGTIGEDTAVAAMRAGAQDYITKGNLKRLIPAVERELREMEFRRERARTEAEKHTLEARFRNILNIAADAVISIDQDQRITIFNQGAERMFGYSADEVIGQLLELLLPGHYSAAHRKHVEEFARGPDVARHMNEQGDVYGRRKDGEEFPAEASISKLTENGRTTFTVILRDITERKRAEQELRLLQGVTHAMTEAGDVYAAIAVTLAKVCEATDWVLAQAWVPRVDGSVLECSPAWSARESGLESFRAASLGLRFAAGEELPGRVWASRQPLWLSDLSEEQAYARAPRARAAGLQASMAIPVQAGEETMAVIEFFMRERRAPDQRLIGLVSSVAAQLGTVVQRKRAEERLHHLAHHDPLTGLPNRLLFMDRLQQAMFEANRHGHPVGLAFLDLDRFKTINDSLGHVIGDMLLKQVAERLAQCVREGDTVARPSGDEFTLILSDVGHAGGAGRVAQRILDSFLAPFSVSGHELFTSASMGVTLYPFDEGTVEGLLRNADIAMYRAKERGRNTYEFYSADMTSKAHARLALENALRSAVDREEFLLHYQPVVDLSTGQMTGIEALMRWQHPERGLVSPAEFIPVAEETGLIVRMGDWALRAGCKQWRKWCAENGQRLRLAVNVSPRQFHHGSLLKIVKQVLEETGFDPHWLDLEITETLLMQHAESTLVAMRELGTLGVHFSIDDFGTGYSSLSYLKHLPIGSVKIDRSFVRDIPDDGNDSAIVTAIISMAHDLGLKVIAEGVETEEQLNFLRDRKCDALQGYCFSPPVRSEELVQLLQAGKRLPL